MEHPALLLIIEGSLQQDLLVLTKLERIFQVIQTELRDLVEHLLIAPVKRLKPHDFSPLQRAISLAIQLVLLRPVKWGCHYFTFGRIW